MTTRDTTLGATWRNLRDLGYGVTSATHPDRIISRGAHSRNRDRLVMLADHPAAVMLCPSAENGCDFDEPEKRGVVALTITAYLLSDPRQYKAVMGVLSEYELTGGPSRTDSFGNRVHLLQWNGTPIYEGEFQARLCFDADDRTVVISHAIRPALTTVRDQWGGMHQVDKEPVGSHIVPIDGEWKDGHILDTPRRKLPELHKAHLRQIIERVEEARWGARPLVNSKEAA